MTRLFPAFALSWLIAPVAAAQPVKAVLPDGVATRDVKFFSEGVQCFGRIFLPKGLTADSKAPAVVLAPGWGETEASIEKYGARFSARGLVAMAIDYRGWGKSGAFIYMGEAIRWDDRLRFSQHTAKVRLRRRRIVPEAQVIDIRNAITFLQGEPGVDASRVGVLGIGLSGAHVVATAANDARVKAGDEILLTAVHGFGQCQCRFCLADARRSDQQKHPDRLVGIG